MTASTYELNRPAAWVEVPQFGVGKIVLMFAWPAIWYTVLLYVLGRFFIPIGSTTPTWFLLLVIILGGGAELAAGLVLLKREGYQLTVDALRNRIRICWPKGRKAWSLAVLVLILGLSLSMVMEPVNVKLAALPWFAPPQWWHAASNPTIEVNSAADVFPDIISRETTSSY